jgi:hypothetical protein
MSNRARLHRSGLGAILFHSELGVRRLLLPFDRSRILSRLGLRLRPLQPSLPRLRAQPSLEFPNGLLHA